MVAFTESEVEGAALAWAQACGWMVVRGPDIAPDTPAAERANYAEVVLAQRLRKRITGERRVRHAEAFTAGRGR